MADGRANRRDQMRFATEVVSCELCAGSLQRPKATVPAAYSAGSFRIMECVSCGLVYVSPRLCTEYRDACYEQETHLVKWFRAGAESLPEAGHPAVSAVLSTGVVAGNWLDIGCGIGTLLDCAREAGFTTFGIELNGPCADAAAARHSVLCANAYDADIARGFYDVVTMTQVLEHVAEPARPLNLVAGWLRPGGVALIAVPTYDWLREDLSAALGTVRPSLRAYSPEDHLYYYRPTTMGVLLRSAGLQQLDLSSAWTRRQRMRRRTMSLLGLSRGDHLAVRCRQ